MTQPFRTSNEGYKKKKWLKKKRKIRLILNNSVKKPKSSFRDKVGKIIPATPNCRICGKKNIHHHYYCDKHWKEVSRRKG